MNACSMLRSGMFIGTVLCTCLPGRASDDALTCVREITMPSAYSSIFRQLPTTVKVQVEIGDGGVPRSVEYDTTVKALTLQLDAYFLEKTKYLDSCRGKKITFTVEYSIVDPALDFAVSEVRFEPPDRFFVVCHRLKPSLDPARSHAVK